MPRFRLTLAYDGTDFAGSQIQPNQRTVQGELEDALGGIAGDPDSGTTFAGRTDRGVHAVGQVVAVDAAGVELATALDLLRALNARLPGDLGAIDAAACADVRSILGSTRCGASIATGSRPGWSVHFSAAMPGHRRRRSMLEPMRAGGAATRGNARLRVVRGRR